MYVYAYLWCEGVYACVHTEAERRCQILRTGVTGVFWVPHLGLGIPTQVLMIVQQMLLTTELSFQPRQQSP